MLWVTVNVAPVWTVLNPVQAVPLWYCHEPPEVFVKVLVNTTWVGVGVVAPAAYLNTVSPVTFTTLALAPWRTLFIVISCLRVWIFSQFISITTLALLAVIVFI